LTSALHPSSDGCGRDSDHPGIAASAVQEISINLSQGAGAAAG
jgi:hypothetical protein